MTLVYDGGIYRFNELQELIEDTGSFILRREDTAVSVTVVIAASTKDYDVIQRKSDELGGKLSRAPLAGIEIAVVAPSPSGRHLPHPTCDIAEYLRRAGAQTILISLARGVGQEPLVQVSEERLMNECDAAVFMMGDSRYCLETKKARILRNLKVPVVVTGGPDRVSMPNVDTYVGGFGRRATRMIRNEDIVLLDRLLGALDSLLEDRRRVLYPALPPISLPALNRSIQAHIPEIEKVLSPAPITIKLDGLRIKLPYDEFSERVASLDVNGRRLGDLARISRSVLKDYILVRFQD